MEGGSLAEGKDEFAMYPWMVRMSLQRGKLPAFEGGGPAEKVPKEKEHQYQKVLERFLQKEKGQKARDGRGGKS